MGGGGLIWVARGGGLFCGVSLDVSCWFAEVEFWLSDSRNRCFCCSLLKMQRVGGIQNGLGHDF
jgi:hypothetical protein